MYLVFCCCTQVDIFSLGISLYEVVTLRKLPPEGSLLDFNADIIAGRRPEFLPEVCSP